MQRQHVRIEIGGSAKINNAIYKIKDISVSGFSVRAAEKVDNFLSGKVKFLFPFTNYSLQFEANAQLVKDNREKETAHFKFMELDAAQMSLVSYIVNARMTGSLVLGPDLINAAARNSFVELKPRGAVQGRKGLAENFKRVLPTALISLIGLAGLAFFLGNIYENSAVIKSYQGVVKAEEITVRAQAEGTVRYLVAEEVSKVSKGQPLAAIAKTSGDPGMPAAETTIASPCDCIIVKQQGNEGDFKSFGEPLFTLAPASARPWVSMYMEPERAHSLRLQDDVSIRVAGEGGFITGYVTDIKAEGVDMALTQVRIKPEKAIPLEMLGRPVYAEFSLYK